MKRFTLTVLLLAAASENVFAQSSVTLYGIVDEGLVFNSNVNGGRQYSLVSGVASGSRWGLAGNEDLGGGLKAIFDLEGGFSSSTGALGQNGDLFGRAAYVGFDSTKFGTVTFGRQYPTGYNYVGSLTASPQWAAGGTGYGGHPSDMDNMDGSYRLNNSVKFKSADFSGFSFGGTYSFGGIAGDFSRNQVYSLGLGYSGGPLIIAAAYTSAKNPNFSLFGNKANDSTTGSNISGPIIGGYATAGSQDIAAVGANYKIGAGLVGLIYSHVSFNNLGATPLTGSTQAGLRGNAIFNLVEANGRYMLTPALQLGVAYIYTAGGSMHGRSGARYNQFDLGLDYFLSKRTDLYAGAYLQTASGYDSTGNQAVAQIAGASSSNRQFVATAGIRHKF